MKPKIRYYWICIWMILFLFVLSGGVTVNPSIGHWTCGTLTEGFLHVAYAATVHEESTILTDAKSVWFSYGDNGEVDMLLRLKKPESALSAAVNVGLKTRTSLKNEENSTTMTTCGDHLCVAAGEDTTTCQADCLVCGNGRCDAGETCSTCETDCGVCEGGGGGGGGGDGGCFLVNTPIIMADGTQKPIQEIRPGDKVLSFNEKTKKIAPDTVIRLLVHKQKTDEFLIVNNDLFVTANHHFYTQGRWKPIGKMKLGNEMTKTDLTIQVINDIKRLKSDSPLTIYNFTTKQYHNYFAGGFLVHNLEKFAGDGCDPMIDPLCPH